MKNDYFYLYVDFILFFLYIKKNFKLIKVKTQEKNDYHITSNSLGFFVNNSSLKHFDHTPSQINQNFVYYSLIDLLNSISPIFQYIIFILNFFFILFMS